MAQSVGRMPPESRIAVFCRDGDSNGDVYRLVAATGFPGLSELAAARGLTVMVGSSSGHIGRVVSERSSIWIDDCAQDPMWHLPERSIASAYLKPVILSDAVVAVLAFLSTERAAFNPTARVLADRLSESFQHLALASRRLAQLEDAEARLATIIRVARGRSDSQDEPVRGHGARHGDPLADSMSGSGFSVAESGRTSDSPTSTIDAGLAALSPRERQVLAAFRRQRRVSSISDSLEISPHTVRNHLKSIFQKLGVHSQVELLATVGTVGPGEPDRASTREDGVGDDLAPA